MVSHSAGRLCQHMVHARAMAACRLHAPWSFPKLGRCISTTPSRLSNAYPRQLLGRYTDQVPVDLARVQSGRHVRLRDYETQKALRRFSYDLKLRDGKVWPAQGDSFIGPNGCSLREPLSPTFQEVVRNFRGANILVFVIPKGTPIPPSLTILHEHSDHYSMQCTSPMTLDDLNDELTEFIAGHGRAMDKAQFDEEYPFTI